MRATVWSRLLALLTICRHRDALLERRPVEAGTRGRLHLVCPRCGRSRPLIDLSDADEPWRLRR